MCLFRNQQSKNIEELKVLTLTDSARKELDAFFEGKEKAPIRIYMAGGCSGPRLALALDEPGAEDKTEEQAGHTFCINAELLEQVQGVTVDLNHMGFVVEPATPLPVTGGGCSSCAGCGGH